MSTKYYHPDSAALVDNYFQIPIYRWVVRITIHSLPIFLWVWNLKVLRWWQSTAWYDVFCWPRMCSTYYLYDFVSSYRRYFGVIVPHRRAAVFTARRCELVDVMDHTLHYLNRNAMVQIYSPYSGLPRYVSPCCSIIIRISSLYV